MKRAIPFVMALALAGALLVRISLPIRQILPQGLVASEPRIIETYGKLPLSFEANHGQTDSSVRFLSRGNGYTLFLTANEAVLALKKSEERNQESEEKQILRFAQNDSDGTGQGRGGRGKNSVGDGAVLRMKLVGANPNAEISGLDELPGKSNYFIGNDPAKWRTNVPTYAKVRYENVYSGIDLVYYGNQRELEYDFVVAPGADPEAIRLDFNSADKVEVDAQGDLLLHASGEQIRVRRPVIYQEAEGGQAKILGGYALDARNEVSFQIAAYDVAKPLVIDPVLVYSTYLTSGSASDLEMALDATDNVYFTGTISGGSFLSKLGANGTILNSVRLLNAQYSNGIAIDLAGNIYVAGSAGRGFPTTAGSFQPVASDLYQDAMVAKFGPDGTLIYATFLGGDNYDEMAMGIAIDSGGNALVVGRTNSSNFPLRNPVQGVFVGGACPTGGFYWPCGDAFVTKLNSTGSALVFSTYLGGSGDESGKAIALDGAGNAYITGETPSTNFPVTPGAFQQAIHGRIDAYVSKFSPDGQLLYSTYLGGSFSQQGQDIAVDSSGIAHVVGNTSSPNFPVTLDALQATYKGGEDVFLTKLNPGGTGLVYATFLGGSGADQIQAIALDSSGNPHLLGWTLSTDFPQADRFQDPPRVSSGGSSPNYYRALFLTKLNASGSALLLSTYLGGMSSTDGSTPLDIKVDAASNIYVAGGAGSTDFPAITPFPGSRSNFIEKFNPAISIRIASVSPASVPQMADATLTASGVGFQPNSVVHWNGGDLPTTFVNTDTLQAFVPGSLATRNTTGLITVWTPGIGGSNTLSVSVFIPTPQLMALDPSSVSAGNSRFTLNLLGDAFVPESYVVFGGARKQTTFVSRNLLQVTVFADEVFSERTIPVVVYNDAPRPTRYPGIFSNTLTFTVSGTDPFINPGGIVNNASFALHPAPIAPGTIIAIFGSNLTKDNVIVDDTSLGPDGKIVTTLGGASVKINGIAAPMLRARPSQLVVQMPVELTGVASAQVEVSVEGQSQSSTPQTFFVDALSPGIFTVGAGQGAILNAVELDQGIKSLAAAVGSFPNARPARPGETVVIFCTGLGRVNDPVPTGVLPSGLHTTVEPTTVIIDGLPVVPDYAGLAPNNAGLYQVNVRIPNGTRLGSNIPVALTIGGATSNTVTIAVQESLEAGLVAPSTVTVNLMPPLPPTVPVAVPVTVSLTNRGTTSQTLTAATPCDVHTWTLTDLTDNVIQTEPPEICIQVVASRTIAPGETITENSTVVLDGRLLRDSTSYKLKYRFWGVQSEAKLDVQVVQ